MRRRPQDPRSDIAVTDARGVRTLHVGGEAIQSAMRIDDPFALALDYTRCMMAFLLFHPRPRQALMIDTWHFFQCGDTFDRLRELDPSLFGYLQLDDALEPSPDTRFDTLNRRALPGEGNLDLVGFMSVCDEIGLEGVVSVELMSEELRRLDVDDYAKRVASTTLDVLDRAEAARRAQIAARPAVIPPSTKIV